MSSPEKNNSEKGLPMSEIPQTEKERQLWDLGNEFKTTVGFLDGMGPGIAETTKGGDRDVYEQIKNPDGSMGQKKVWVSEDDYERARRQVKRLQEILDEIEGLK